ncbi:MAG: hypothetical protein DRO11_09770, partial [Methanobacteriota archaeon]
MTKQLVGLILAGLILATAAVEARIRLQPEPLAKILVVTDQTNYGFDDSVGVTIENVGKTMLDEYVAHLRVVNTETGEVSWGTTFFTDKLVKPGGKVSLSLDLGQAGVRKPGVYEIRVLLGMLYASTRIFVEAKKHVAKPKAPPLEEPSREAFPAVPTRVVLREFQAPQRVVLGQTTRFLAQLENPGKKTVVTTLKIDLPGFSPNTYSRKVVIGPGEVKEVVFEALPEVLGGSR